MKPIPSQRHTRGGPNPLWRIGGGEQRVSPISMVIRLDSPRALADSRSLNGKRLDRPTRPTLVPEHGGQPVRSFPSLPFSLGRPSSRSRDGPRGQT